MSLYRLKLPQANSLLTPDVRAGRAEPALDGSREPLGGAIELDVDLVEALVEHALAHEDLDVEGALDAWLAPKLHYIMRLPLRVAADRGFWAWLALGPCRKYVLHRWKRLGTDGVTAYRFTGDVTRNAVARLWWYAEMARNGPDYRYVEEAFKDTGTLQYAMELAYSRYRPAVIAFVRVARAHEGGSPLKFEEMKLLSKRINAYLSLRALEFFDLSDDNDEEYDATWRADPPSTLEEVLQASPLHGPRDGYANAASVESLEKWFRELRSTRVAA